MSVSPLSLSHSRLIEGILVEGSIHAPKISHPLPLRLSGLSTLVFTGVLFGALPFRYGRLWWLGAVVFFSAVGIVKMTVKP